VSDSFTVYLPDGGEFSISLDERSALEEWEDFKNWKGRWASEWVKVRSDSGGDIYIDPGAVVKVKVNHKPPPSGDVAARQQADRLKAESGLGGEPDIG